MRVGFFAVMIVMLFGMHSLCFGDTREPSGSGSGQKVVADQTSTQKAAPKVEIYVTDW